MLETSPRLDVADPRAALRELFGYPDFRPGQDEVVRAVLGGEDVLAVMPTGAGKSLCYQLPAMLLPGCTIVISPLVALMKDQLDSLPGALRQRAAVFNSTVERDELDAGMVDLAAGRLKLVYVAPERLRQRPFLHALARARISRFVVDEAHCVSLWGHDFRPDYLFIPSVVEMLGSPPVLAMTATATPELQTELRGRFARPLRVIHTGVLRPNLSLEVETAANEEEKLRRLIDICAAERGAGIVYVSSRKKAEEAARILYRQGRIAARHYHAGMEKDERAAVQDAFMQGRVRVIVATVAFGMGVDKPDVRFIVHLNPSRSLEAYAQESGRAGRDGEPARCILFWSPSDKAALNRWARDDALTPALLQAVYRAVRQRVRGHFAWWPVDDLVTAARAAGDDGTLDETDVRVAVGALEQVGVLRRHCDLPEMVRLGLPQLERGARSVEYPGRAGTERGTETGAVSAVRREDARQCDVERVVDALGLGPGSRTTLDAFEAASALGCAPSEVEARLLSARDAGALSYQGFGRGLLIELLPRPPDLAERLRTLIEGHRVAQARRAKEMTAYATERSCRAAAVARHFGVAHPPRCGNCDVCRQTLTPARSAHRPSPNAGRGEDAIHPLSQHWERGPGGEGRSDGTAPASRPSQPGRAPEDIIIEAVAALPFAMGRTGVTNLLKGSVKSTVQADRSRHFGALASLSGSVIEREIDRLVEAGYLGRQERQMSGGGAYYALVATADGLAKPPAPWPPERGTRNVANPARIEGSARAVGGAERGTGRTRERSATGNAAEPSADFDQDDPWMQERFERLRAWRTEQAREAALPAYTIFHDATLRLLAASPVGSLPDLSRIKGMGPAKLERYGAALLDLLADPPDA